MVLDVQYLQTVTATLSVRPKPAASVNLLSFQSEFELYDNGVKTNVLMSKL